MAIFPPSPRLPALPFTALTCNVLADSYVRRDWYPHTPEEWLDPRVRHPAVAEYLATLACDIICLQEVEGPMYATLNTRLLSAGYAGELARKGLDKPDGCATFWRAGRLKHLGSERIEYGDASTDRAASGHIAQLTLLRDGAQRLGIANTHLKWDPPKKKPEQLYGHAQIAELLAACAAADPACGAWIICGDFNVTPDTALVATLRGAGYEFAHHAHPQAYTAAPNRDPRMIDYLFHSGALRATPMPPPLITGQTPLPGPDYPSDHLALAAQFDWV